MTSPRVFNPIGTSRDDELGQQLSLEEFEDYSVVDTFTDNNQEDEDDNQSTSVWSEHNNPVFDPLDARDVGGSTLEDRIGIIQRRMEGLFRMFRKEHAILSSHKMQIQEEWNLFKSARIATAGTSSEAAAAAKSPQESSKHEADSAGVSLMDLEKMREHLEHMQERLTAEREQFEREKQQMKKVQNFQSSKILLDVGGIPYTTSIETLTKHDGSMLALMFSGKFALETSSDGRVFIDRDGQHFRYILNYLRDGVVDLPNDPIVVNEIQREAEYYQLSGLLAQLPRRHDEGLKGSLQAHDERILNFDDVQILEGHRGAVRCFQFDEVALISGGDDKTVKVWDVHNGQCSQTLLGHTDSVLCLSFSSKEQILVTGSYDKTLRVWSLSKHSLGHCIRVLTGHTSFITAVQFDGKTRTLVSSSDDKTIRVWNIDTRECNVIQGHARAVWCVQFEGDVLASGSDDCSIRVWSLRTGTCSRTMLGHRSTVLCLQLQDNQTLISGSADKTIKIWSLESGNCLRTLLGHTLAVKCLAVRGNALISGSQDNTIKVWNLGENGKCVRTLTHHDSFVNCLGFKGGVLISGSSDTTLRIFRF